MLSKQLDLAAMHARRAGLHDAADWIERNAPKGRDLTWPFGRCIWCSVEDPPRSRKATHLDSGTGTACCDRHAYEAVR